MSPIAPRLPAALAALVLVAPALAAAQGAIADADLARRTDAVLPKVVAWRRDIHQHPELGNQEVRTAKLAADHLRALGMEVKTGIGGHGVVGILKGGRPGKVVALRADMDALPVTEQVDLPFASKVRATYNGQEVGVMHACGHDNHVAILMGAAEVLAGARAQLPGTVVFVFQPNEEGEPGKPQGAMAMLNDGLFDGKLGIPKPDAIFGLHVGVNAAEAGHITYRANGFMAGADYLKITVRGRQAHGATPWNGVDPVVAASLVVTGLQTVVSRQSDLTVGPAVVTIGSFNGGVRNNIIPDSAVLQGTIRTFDPAMRKDVQARVKRVAESIAQSQGATAEVVIQEMTPVTANDPALTARMAGTLRRVAGAAGASEGRPVTGAEDVGYFAERVPGLFVFLGVRPKGTPASEFVLNHSPKFFADESALPNGVKAMAALASDFLAGGGQSAAR